MKKNDIWHNAETKTTVTFGTNTLTQEEKKAFLDSINPAGRTPTAVTTIFVRDAAAANDKKSEPKQAAKYISCNIM